MPKKKIVNTSKPSSVETVFPAVVDKTTLPVEDSKKLPDTADKVGSVMQKEKSAYEAGLTRRKYISAIVELLEAEDVETVYDQMGRASTVKVPNLEKRAKGAELAGKFFSDYKENVAVGNVTHNKVVYQWLTAPAAQVVATRV